LGIVADPNATNDVPDQAAEWRHGSFTARSVQHKAGFLKRRTVPGVDITVGDQIRIGFLNRELSDFFDGRTDNLEGSCNGALFYLYRVSDALPPAGEKPLEGVPVGSITVLAASGHVLAPLVVLPPYEAGEFGRWFAAL